MRYSLYVDVDDAFRILFRLNWSGPSLKSEYGSSLFINPVWSWITTAELL